MKTRVREVDFFNCPEFLFFVRNDYCKKVKIKFKKVGKGMNLLKQLRAINRYFKIHVIARKMTIFLVMVSIWISLLTAALLSPKRDIYGSEQLETKQIFSNGTGEINLVSQSYSKENQIIVLQFETLNQISTVTKGIDPSKLTWTLYAKNKDQKTEMEVIPIIDNKISIVIKHVPDNFEAMAIDIKNTTINVNDIDLNIAANDTEVNSKKSDKEDTKDTVQFFISSKSEELKNEQIEEVSREEFAKNELDEEIEFQKSQKEKLENAIRKLEASIQEDESTKLNLEKQTQYLVDEEKTSNDNDIKTIESNIQTKKNSIEKAESDINTIESRLEMLEKKKQDILNGTFEFSSPIKTVPMK